MKTRFHARQSNRTVVVVGALWLTALAPIVFVLSYHPLIQLSYRVGLHGAVSRWGMFEPVRQAESQPWIGPALAEWRGWWGVRTNCYNSLKQIPLAIRQYQAAPSPLPLPPFVAPIVTEP